VTRRGQLVLVAAVLIAVAFVPLVLAYLQLGYQADVRASGAHDDPTEGARSVLVRAVPEASSDVPRRFAWRQRSDAVAAVKTDLAPRIATVETARVEDGIYRNVSYNRTLATDWSARNCPSGPDRQFGDCEAVDGVVVQDRDGRTHVLAVAFDVETTGQQQRTTLATVIERT